MKYQYRIIITLYGKKVESKWQDVNGSTLGEDCEIFAKNGCDFCVETRENST